MRILSHQNDVHSREVTSIRLPGAFRLALVVQHVFFDDDDGEVDALLANLRALKSDTHRMNISGLVGLMSFRVYFQMRRLFLLSTIMPMAKPVGIFPVVKMSANILVSGPEGSIERSG